MAIGLTYTHLNYQERKILPNYIYTLTNTYPDFGELRYSNASDKLKFWMLGKYIDDNQLYKQLQHTDNNGLYDHAVVREILIAAHPYEVDMKWSQQDSDDSEQRNQQLITLFNSYYNIDYQVTLDAFDPDSHETIRAAQRAQQRHQQYYQHHADELIKYMTFVTSILHQYGHHRQAYGLADFRQEHLIIRDNPAISAVTIEEGSDMIVELGSKSRSILYHELTHVVNNYFRYYYNTDGYVLNRVDHTKSNEGFANLIGYNLVEIIAHTGSLDEADLSEWSYSPFISCYKQLQRMQNFSEKRVIQIIKVCMEEYFQTMLDQQKIDHYVERFYKYFHPYQTQYFFPKELLYHIGYQTVLRQAQQATDLGQFLVDYFLCDEYKRFE